MKRFTELYMELDASNRTTAKLAALRRYFLEAEPRDAAWAVFFLRGQRLKRVVKTHDLREWSAESCGFPLWMVEECYGHVGDLAETLALLLANRDGQGDLNHAMSLCDVVENLLIPMSDLEQPQQKIRMLEIWSGFRADECFVFNKLLTGGFRVGVSKILVNRALSERCGDRTSGHGSSTNGRMET